MDCCVCVVVTLVAGWGVVTVEVRSVVVVCGAGSCPQAVSNPMPPSNVAASSNRMAGVLFIKVFLLVCCRSTRSIVRKPSTPDWWPAYWVVVVLVLRVVVTVAGGG